MLYKKIFFKKQTILKLIIYTYTHTHHYLFKILTCNYLIIKILILYQIIFLI
jgi:hypothetical protein